jgi:hypothetical protein
MNTIIDTMGGREWDYANPTAAAVNITDIATALSNTCRYGGFCDPYYSVAEHSVNCARHLRELDFPREYQLGALLHDAHEAYLLDVPTPLKRLLGGTYARLAELHDRAIAEAFDVKPAVFNSDPVKAADHKLLRWEASKLKDSQGLTPKWGWTELPDDVPYWFRPGWTATDARRQFLGWFRVLSS